MIEGEYRRRFPRVTLSLPDADGDLVDVEFIVDTGFEGYLTLPVRVLQRLDATSSGTQTSMMADGSFRSAPLYEMTIDWLDATASVEALVLEGNPLLGTALLENCRLTIDAIEGGEVTIEEMG